VNGRACAVATGVAQNALSTACGATASARAEPQGVGADVRPVAHDDRRAAMDVAQQRTRGQVRRGGEVAPQRAPEHERQTRAAGAEEGGGQGDAARRPAYDRRVAPARGQRVHVALGNPAKGHAGILEPGGGVVRAPAEERELERHARVQRSKRAGAVGRHVVGDEEHRRGATSAPLLVGRSGAYAGAWPRSHRSASS
jgi:hypothetical protein